MSKKPTTKTVIENLNLEIDYDKLAEAIVRAGAEDTIKNAILAAHATTRNEFQKRKEEAQAREGEAVRKTLKIEDCISEDGSIKHSGKLFFKAFFARDKQISGVPIIASLVNGAAAFFFGLVEWLMYFASAGLLIYNICSIIGAAKAKEWGAITISSMVCSFIVSILLLVLARLIVRFIKAECRNNKDRDYMVAFLTMIITIVALIVAIIALLKA